MLLTCNLFCAVYYSRDSTTVRHQLVTAQLQYPSVHDRCQLHHSEQHSDDYTTISHVPELHHWLRVPERIQYKIAVLTYKVLHGTAPRYLGPLDRVADHCTVGGHSALLAPVAWWCRGSDCLQSAVGLSMSLDLGSGMGCPKKLFRRRHFQVFDADLNPSFFSSHILMLSSNC